MRIIRNNEFVNSSATRAVAVNQTFRRHTLYVKFREEIIKERIIRVLIPGIGIAQHYFCALRVEFPEKFHETYLIRVGKTVFRIGGEGRGLVQRAIGWIEIHERVRIDKFSALDRKSVV